MISTAEEFIRLRSSQKIEEYSRATNEAASMDVWLDVVKRFPEYREWVSHNKTVPLMILDDLSRDPSPRIRSSVATKRKAGEEILGRLSLDPDCSVRQCVASNAKAGEQILKKLALDPDYDVRISVVSNSKVPESVLQILAEDVEEEISIRAIKKLNQLERKKKSVSPDLGRQALRSSEKEMSREFVHFRKLKREEERKLRVVNCTPESKDIGENVDLELLRIPGGSFLMGSPDSEEGHRSDEGPIHSVELDGFWMGIFPVTLEQYKTVMEGGLVCHLADRLLRDKSSLNSPVVMISWDDIMKFFEKLNKINAGQFTLPTEAQWEYACRAGSTTPFHFGDTISTDQANYDGDLIYGSGKKGIHREEAIPVGTYPPNAFGIFDMHGNVQERCLDWYSRDYYDCSPRKNPENTTVAECRVVRGGSWYDFPEKCRSAYRDQEYMSMGNNRCGFRVVSEG